MQTELEPPSWSREVHFPARHSAKFDWKVSAIFFLGGGGVGTTIAILSS
jgi:hypothetical protein